MNTESSPQAHCEADTTLERTCRARDIVRDLELVDTALDSHELRYLHIKELLNQSGMLNHEMARVRNLFGERLGEFGNELDDDIWEMLTILELFDDETAEHCVETYRIAKDKVERTLSTGFVLADFFKEEGVDVNTFYRACLLHDIGKVEVPYLVVINKISDPDCARLLFEHKDDVLIPSLKKHLNDEMFVLPENINSGDALLKYLHDTLTVRPQTLAPVRLLLGEMTPSEKQEVERQLAHCVCTLDDSLITVMRPHDGFSERILASGGRKIEGVLASSHHENHGNEYKITVGALQISVDLAHIIHLADVENAIRSMRHYKEGQTPLMALKILAIHSQQKLVASFITYIWIADELHRNWDGNQSEQENYDYIAKFLDTQKSTHLGYPDWRSVHASTPSTSL
ncbi:MAG: HD domain-containing protein [Candidatus Kaiserbacteria bacterium]|nr:HD domain-containing protein [Candidatus Kaiserbacteria bacterium]